MISRLSPRHFLFQACYNNTFGLSCAHDCRCPRGDSCNPVNGVCASGTCALGYSGAGCQLRLPILIDPPQIRRTGTHERNIIWAKFRDGIDIGVGPISQYVLEQQERSASIASSWSARKPLTHTLHICSSNIDALGRVGDAARESRSAGDEVLAPCDGTGGRQGVRVASDTLDGDGRHPNASL